VGRFAGWRKKIPIKQTGTPWAFGRLSFRFQLERPIDEHRVYHACNQIDVMLADNRKRLVSLFRGSWFCLASFRGRRARLGRCLLRGWIFALAASTQAESYEYEYWSQELEFHGFSP
jgi:hypothetical protein